MPQSVPVQSSAANTDAANPQSISPTVPILSSSSGNVAASIPLLDQPHIVTLTVDGQVSTALPSASEVIIGSQVLSINAAVTAADGAIISLSPSGSFLVVAGDGNGDGITSIPLLNDPTPITTTIVDQVITALPSASEVTIGDQILSANSAITAVDGTIISLSPSGSILVIAGSGTNLIPISTATATATEIPPSNPQLNSPIPTPTPTPSSILTAPLPSLSLAGSVYILDGTDITLTPGGPGITVSGTPISLAPSGSYILLGSSTSIPLTPLELLTIGTHTYTASQGGDFVISGQTLVPGATGITVGGGGDGGGGGGIVVSLNSVPTQVVVGVSTESVGIGGLIASGIGGLSRVMSTSTGTGTGTVTGMSTGTGTGMTGNDASSTFPSATTATAVISGPTPSIFAGMGTKVVDDDLLIRGAGRVVIVIGIIVFCSG